MSKKHHQRRRRFSARFWIIVFKAVVGIGQLASLVAKLLSSDE